MWNHETRYPSCSQTNGIKEAWFVGEVCQSPLLKQWNFD